jgi:hypothetical protein
MVKRTVIDCDVCGKEGECKTLEICTYNKREDLSSSIRKQIWKHIDLCFDCSMQTLTHLLRRQYDQQDKDKGRLSESGLSELGVDHTEYR